jgi:hypothetical protein
MLHAIMRGPKFALAGWWSFSLKSLFGSNDCERAGLYAPGFPLLYEYFYILDKLILK